MKKSLYLASVLALTTACERKPPCAVDDDKIVKAAWQKLYDARDKKTFFAFNDNSDSLEQAVFDQTIDSVFQQNHHVMIDAFWNTFKYTDDSGERQKVNYAQHPYSD